MWIYETPKDLADSVRVLSYPYQTRVGDWLEFAVELHTVDERLKLVVTECTCWAGDTVDASKPSYALYNKNLNPCQRERTLELIPMDLTRFAFRYEAFAFTGYDIVTIECDAIVCLKTEATQECDRTCGGFKPPPAYGRRRRRRQAAGEHRIIRVFSGPVYVVNRHVQDSSE
nr:hypothetical protein BaRGS_005677 [Batillaria attramentaria]